MLFNRFIRLFLVILSFISSSVASIDYKTSIGSGNIAKNERFYLQVSFSLDDGHHITHPSGPGRSLAPAFDVDGNSFKILDVIWQEPESIKDGEGNETGYKGFHGKPSILLFMEAQDNDAKALIMRVSYIECSDVCVPKDIDLYVDFDKSKLEQSEIDGFLKTESNASSLLWILLLSFVGGIVLNAMPCVFPILSLKLFSLIQTKDSKSMKRDGILFAAGSVGVFVIIGSIILMLKSAGSSIGWGFFMQNPIFLCCICALFIVVAMSLFDIIYVPMLSYDFRKVETSSSSLKSVFNGAFSAIASATCVGPFVGVAIAYGISTTHIADSFLVFLFLGLGVSFPYALVSFIPKIQKVLPKPGEWMNRVKELIGFLMILSAVWILWILGSQLGLNSAFLLLVAAIFFAMSIWALGKRSGKTFTSLAAIVFVLISVIISACAIKPIDCQSNELLTEPFSFEKISEAREQRQPILIVFTANWCLNCKVNETILDDAEIVELLKQNNVLTLKADWTNRDDYITDALNRYGYSSVPLILFFNNGADKPVVLPHLISKKDIKDLFRDE